MQRLIRLETVDMVDIGNDEREAVVSLLYEGRQFTGRSKPAPDEDSLQAIARATLDAVRQCLPTPVNFQLKKAAKVDHDTIASHLFVSVVELVRETDRVSLTGSCLGQDEQANDCAAKATMDAVNRVMDAILQGEYEDGRQK